MAQQTRRNVLVHLCALCLGTVCVCVCVCVCVSVCVAVCVVVCAAVCAMVRQKSMKWYGVATVSRIDKMIGRFCKRAL